MTFKATIEITGQQVAAIMSTGLEGGYSPWLKSALWIKKPQFYEEQRITPIMTGAFYEGDFQIEFIFDDPDEEEGTFTGKKLVGPKEMQAAIEKFSEESPSHFADWMLENDDADTGDVFLQYICLNDIIYG